MKALLVVIDFQEKLIKHISQADEILRNSVKLIRACQVLGIPVILTEQIKLGETVEKIKSVIKARPIQKSSFSCVKCKRFREELARVKPERCILTGIEAHICVLQTALDLLRMGYKVYVVLDCIGSRKPLDKETSIRRMIQEGIAPMTAEAVIYEMLETAEHEKFKKILEIVKS